MRHVLLVAVVPISVGEGRGIAHDAASIMAVATNVRQSNQHWRMDGQNVNIVTCVGTVRIVNSMSVIIVPSVNVAYVPV